MSNKHFPSNPVGRPRGSAWVKHLAAKYTQEALESLAEIARDVGATASARVSAWNAILDRAHGKPAQEVNGTINVSKSPDELYERLVAAVAEVGLDDDAGSTGETH